MEDINSIQESDRLSSYNKSHSLGYLPTEHHYMSGLAIFTITVSFGSKK